MSLSIAQIKSGMVVTLQGNPFLVMSSSHLKLGRGRGIQKVRLKSLPTGTTTERTFRGNEVVEEADVTTVTAQFLYQDAAAAHFMGDDYESFAVSLKPLGDKRKFLKEGQQLQILYVSGEPIDVRLPIKMEFTVTSAQPGVRGDRASPGTKPAKIETGAVIQVPLHIKTGDRIIVDTRDGSYVERAKA